MRDYKAPDKGVPRLARNRSSRPNSQNVNDADWRFTAIPSEGEQTPINASTSREPSSASTSKPLAHVSPVSDTDTQPDPTNAIAPYQYQHPNNLNLHQPPLSPTSAAHAAAAVNLDPAILSTTIGSLLQSPAAAQMFLNSLNNSIQGQALQTPGNKIPNSYGFPPSSGQMDQLQSRSNYPMPSNTNPNPDPNADPTLALFSPLPNSDALLAHNDALMKSYQDAVNMDTDVNGLQESINELVRSMGLDVPNQSVSGAGVAGGSGGPGGGGIVGGNAGNMMGYDPNLDLMYGNNSSTGQDVNQVPDLDDPVLDLPDGFDVDEFLKSLHEGQQGVNGS